MTRALLLICIIAGAVWLCFRYRSARIAAAILVAAAIAVAATATGVDWLKYQPPQPVIATKVSRVPTCTAEQMALIEAHTRTKGHRFDPGDLVTTVDIPKLGWACEVP